MENDNIPNDILHRIRDSSEEREKVAIELLNNRELVNAICKVIKSKGGSDRDIRPILHMSIVSFFKRVICDKNFELETNIVSYCNGIAKYLWYAELRKRRIKTLPLEDAIIESQIAPAHDLIIIDKDKKAALHRLIGDLGDKCKKVLLLWASGYSMKEIVMKTDYNNASAVRKKKFDCMKKLAKVLEDKPHIKDMFI